MINNNEFNPSEVIEQRKLYSKLQDEAYTCLEYILQSYVCNKKDNLFKIINNFGDIYIAYYNEMKNIMREKGVFLPYFNQELFITMMLFPTNDMYLNNKENKDMMSGIPSFIKAKENQIKLENKLYKHSQDIRYDSSFCDNSFDIYKEKVNEFTFDLLKTILTKKIASDRLGNKETGEFYPREKIMQNYCKDIPAFSSVIFQEVLAFGYKRTWVSKKEDPNINSFDSRYNIY